MGAVSSPTTPKAVGADAVMAQEQASIKERASSEQAASKKRASIKERASKQQAARPGAAKASAATNVRARTHLSKICGYAIRDVCHEFGMRVDDNTALIIGEGEEDASEARGDQQEPKDRSIRQDEACWRTRLALILSHEGVRAHD
jgi:hypothetical protein